MRQFIEYASELPTVCGDPSEPRCHKGSWEINLEGSEMRCVFSKSHDGPCQYNKYTEKQS